MNDRTMRRADAPGGSAGGPVAGPFAEKGPAGRPARPCQPEARNASRVGRYRAGGRHPQLCSSGARSTRPAIASRNWCRGISAAPSASPISIFATPRTPTRRSRTHSSRYSPISGRIAKRGRSRCGLRESSSTAVSTAGRRARAANAGSRPSEDARPDEARSAFGGAAPLDPEARLLARERRAKLASAIDRLDGRQRTVFMLCHYGDCTPREVSAITGLNESTVRVHLFRAARKLRGLLGGKP